MEFILKVNKVDVGQLWHSKREENKSLSNCQLIFNERMLNSGENIAIACNILIAILFALRHFPLTFAGFRVGIYDHFPWRKLRKVVHNSSHRKVQISVAYCYRSSRVAHQVIRSKLEPVSTIIVYCIFYNNITNRLHF